MSDAQGTPPPLDLAAIQASLAGAEYTWGRDHELLVTLRALLAHCRALRAALRQHGAHDPSCDHLVLLTSDPPSRKPCSCGLAAILAAARDGSA